MSGAPVRLVGIGNRYRHDDGVGIAVVEGVSGRLPAGASAHLCEGEPAGLLEAWEGAEAVLVVDAVSSGAAPGTIHRLEAAAEPLPAALFRGSTHAFGLAEAVELGRALGRLPGRLAVFGIEGERFDAGEGLSPAVGRAAAELEAELLAACGGA